MELTNFDKYMLEKEQKCKEEVREFSPEYAEYVERELRRKEPSGEKFLSARDFEMQRRAADETQEKKGVGAVAAVVQKLKYKNFGKAFLCLYVLIFMALALVVIINAYQRHNGLSTEFAGASNDTVNEECVVPMTLEEEEKENEDSFDVFCDSLK